MNSLADDLIAQIKALEIRVEDAISTRRAEFGYRIEQGRLAFEEEVAVQQRKLKSNLAQYVFGIPPLFIVTLPFIYSLIIPIVLLDLFASLYQAVCFPIYGIEKVSRHPYIVMDRHRLPYLNAVEKLNCAYCSYGNGVLAYVGEIASRTEQFWCPIKHAQRLAGAHRRYGDFIDFGDAEGYKQKLESLRTRLHAQSKSASEK
jgi:hypothetical protein